MGKIQDYSKYFSAVSSARKPSAIRALAPLVSIPGMISLGGGLPNPSAFPFAKMTIELNIAEGKSVPLVLEGDKLKKGLQYSATPGLPDLIIWLKTLQRKVHNSPLTDDEVSVQITTGSQDGLWKAFEMLLEPGDTLLCEFPTYSGVLAFLGPFGTKLESIPVKDGDGIDVDALKELLENWPADKKKPKAMYTIPVGQNPSGATMSLERKKEVYKLACEHDFIIMEDDPYYYVYYGDVPVPLSFHSMDTEGRVIRFDSFSKILSSGMRLGFVTGPSPLVRRIELHMQATSLHACGLSQTIMVELLNNIGYDGFFKHIKGIQDLYRERRDWCMEAASKHLGDFAEFHKPTAGMFLWMKLKGVDDTNALITKEAVEKKVLMVPGQSFTPSGSPGSYVRASFSTASKEQIEEAFARLASLLGGK